MITVVVPTRGAPAFLTEALASVRADSSAPAHVIVVEDGTREVPDDLVGDGTLIRLPYVGRSAARNAAVKAAETELVAFLDADDVTLPGRFAAQAEALESSPGAALCFGRAEVVDGDLKEIPRLTEDERRRFDDLLGRGCDYDNLVVDCPIYTSATMVRRDAFLDVGGYDVFLDAYEDLDLYLRLARSSFLVPAGRQAVALHRIHGANTPSPELSAGSFHVARKHLANASPASARLLGERRVDAYWTLGDFRRARREALALARRHPRLLGHRRFAKRLVSSALPISLLSDLRERRS